MSWSADGQVKKLERENEQLKNELKQRINTNGVTQSFFWGLLGGLTSSYQPLIGRAISATGLAYYHSILHSVTLGIGHVFGHLLTQAYQSNSDNKPGQKLTYL